MLQNALPASEVAMTLTDRRQMQGLLPALACQVPLGRLQSDVAQKKCF